MSEGFIGITCQSTIKQIFLMQKIKFQIFIGMEKQK